MTGGSGFLALMGGALLVGELYLLARIGWRDAHRFEISPLEVTALAAFGLTAHGLGLDDSTLTDALLGTALGLTASIAVLAHARLKRRRLPMLGGDVILFMATGAVLGPQGLAVSWLLLLPFGLLYRAWLCRRRARASQPGLTTTSNPGVTATVTCPWHQHTAPPSPSC